MKTVVIAGGKGTRIASVNSDIPKAMIPIEGKPILEYEIIMAREQGFTDFIFIIGHLGRHIREYFGDGSRFGVNIEYYEETEPLGTAGALAYLADKLEDDFFVFYGDTVMDIDMRAMADFHRSHGSKATLLVHPNDHPYDSDIVIAGDDCRIKAFANKPHPEGFVSKNSVNAALFIFSPDIVGFVEKGKKSHIEKDVLPRALAAGLPLYGYTSHEYIKDMGTPERYAEVSHDVVSGKVKRMNRHNPRPCIFLDRDGVINEEVNLLDLPERLRLIDGAAEAIKLINRQGWLAVVVTNQPVIARNLCSIEELEEIHATLETMLGREGAYLNGIYYCPHHPDSGYPEERKEYKIRCDCRKPAPGLLLRAKEDLNIDMTQSVMIGDRDSDILAGKNAGCARSVKIDTNRPFALLETINQLFTLNL